jgi:hypothetical protein
MAGEIAALRARSDDKLMGLIELIEEENLEEASLGEAYLERRGADVLAHLHGWHLQFLEWLRLDGEGAEVVTPAPGYTWENLRAYNDALYETFRALDYRNLKNLVTGSHCRMFAALEALGDAAVTDPARFPWADGPLLAMADACSGAHYEWGLERITRALG